MLDRLFSPRNVLLALPLLVLLAYVSALDCGFVWDDRPVVLEDARVRSVDHWGGILTRPYGSDVALDPLYRPVVVFSYAVDRLVWGMEPRGFHLTGILLHLATCVLLYFTLGELADGVVAGLAAFLFAAHPVHVEAVTWITGRSDLLGAFFAVLAVYLYLRARASPRRRWLLAGACVAYLLGLLAKEVVAGLPLVLAGIDRAQQVPLRRKPFAAFAGVFLAWLALRYAVLGRIGGGLSLFEAWKLDLGTRLHVAGAVLADHLRLLFYPARLAADYAINRDPAVARAAADSPAAWLGLGLAVAALPVAYRIARRAPLIAIGLAWYALFLFPASNLLLPIGIVEAERLLYLPSAGLVLAAAAVAAGAGRARTAAAWILLALVPLLAGRAFFRNLDWRDDDKLYRSMIDAEPRNPYAQAMLGTVLTRAGKLDEAEQAFAAAIALQKDCAMAYAGRGEVRRLRGDFAGAVENFNLAESAAPTARTRVNRALTLLEAGEVEAARREAQAAVTAFPGSADAWNGLGALHLTLRDDLPAALAAFEKALALRPGQAIFWSNRGLAKFYLKDAAGALRDQEEAIRLDSEFADAHQRRGLILYDTGGDLGESERSLRAAIRLAPSDVQAHNTLALILCARRDRLALFGLLQDMDARGIAIRKEVLEEAGKLKK